MVRLGLTFSGGSLSTLAQDLDQAHKMVNMRIKVDVWSKGLEEAVRRRIRENLRDMFCELLPRRIWYYLKQVRTMELNRKSKHEFRDPIPIEEEAFSGPEDVIADCKSPQVRGRRQAIGSKDS